MNSFFVSQLDYIFFIYGLSFIMLFATIQGLKKLDDSGIKWHWLGIFALLHGVLEWSDLIASSLGDSLPFKGFRLILMTASFVPLIEFARVNTKIKVPVAIYFPLAILIATSSFLLPLNDTNAIARYTMVLVATIWSAIVIINTTKNSTHLFIHYRRIAICLIGYGISAGSIVPNGSFFPSSIINNDSFLAFFGFPIQLLRAFFAVCVAYNTWKLWRNINTKKGSMFGIAPETLLDSIAVYTILGFLLLGWISMSWSAEIIANICSASDTFQAMKEYRLSEIFKTAIVVLLLIGLFVLIQSRVTSKLHLDISKKMLETVFADSPNPMFVKYSNNQYMMVNDAFCKLYGVEKDALIGSSDREFDGFVLSKLRERDFTSYNSPPLPTEEVFIGINGAKQIFQTSFSQINIPNGIVLVGTMSDITELRGAFGQLEKINRNLENEVEHRVEELRQKDSILIQQSRTASMGEMISAIAHQWRQPLNSLAIMVQDTNVAYSFGEMSEKYIGDFVEKSMKQIQFMSKTIDDFRNFLKPDKQKSDFAPCTKIAEIIELLMTQLNASGIDIKLNNEDKSLVSGYDKEFGQVVLNILNNAKDVLVELNIDKPLIVIDEYTQDDKFIITIEDNAGGIQEDIMDRIFDPYYTTKEQGKGTGIGLYISKMIIESHMNGKLSVENSYSGALFKIEIPLCAKLES